MSNNFPLDMFTLSIAENNNKVLLLLAGKSATDILPSIVKHYVNRCEIYRNFETVPPFCEDNLHFPAVSKKTFSCNFKNYKYAVIAFDNEDVLAVKFAEKICPILKNEGICTVAVTVDTFDSENNPFKTELPLEISRKNIIDSSDALVITHLENYSEGTYYSAIFSRMVTMLIDSYTDCTYEEKDLMLKDIKNSGIAYYSETFSSDFRTFEDLAERAVFDSLFQCPYYAAADVFCNITHGSNWNSLDCCEELFSSTDAFLNSNAAFFASADCVPFLSKDAIRFQFLFFGFNGKSSVFGEDYTSIYPEFPNSDIKNNIETMFDNYCDDY